MEKFNYDSYCGIYCGACDIMMSYKTGDKYRLASFWNESMVKTFQDKLGLVYDAGKAFTYQCYGCKTDTLFVNCFVCQIRKCAINSKVEHCLDCGKYPCKLIVDSRKMVSLLPHIKSNHDNMATIKKVGMNRWLSEQGEKWKCPKCNTDFSWYSHRCKNCGHDLKRYTFKFSFLRSFILKMAIFVFMPKQK
jgi:hypothetical protein